MVVVIVVVVVQSVMVTAMLMGLATEMVMGDGNVAGESADGSDDVGDGDADWCHMTLS